MILVFCDDNSFIELLLSDENYMLVFGVFECKKINPITLKFLVAFD